jgi:hypothetical protein
MATMAFAPAMAPATRNGTRGLHSAASAPIAGPPMKPTANAVPSNPKSRARSLGGATSATDACATETLAPEMPSSTRAKKRIVNDPARPVSTLPTAVPASDSTRTGLRPIRSDTQPQTGANRSCATENDASSAPICVGVAPKRSA